MFLRGSYRSVVEFYRTEFELEIALQLRLHVFADRETHGFVQAWRPVEKQNALDQFFSVFHFVDRLLLDELAQLAVMPVLTHFRVQEVLIDGGQFFFERILQRSNDLWISLHGSFPVRLSIKDNYGVVGVLARSVRGLPRCDSVSTVVKFKSVNHRGHSSQRNQDRPSLHYRAATALRTADYRL